MVLDGDYINQESEHYFCKNKCKVKECLISEQPEFVCSHNLSTYFVRIKDLDIRAYGYVGQKVNLSKSSKFFKNSSKGRNLKYSFFKDWSDNMNKTLEKIEENIQLNTSDVLHKFHDPVKWATQTSLQANRLINKSAGNTFSEKLNNTTKEIITIYKSSQMLVDSINSIEIYFNPDSASFGEKRPTELYRLFDKVQAIIFHAEGKKYNKRFRLKGSSFNKVSVYDSFSNIALSLLQNAIKYSKSNEIEINIEDRHDGVFVSVSSDGVLISDDECGKIFDKGFRGIYAKKLHHDGMGIGLYIAQKVANAHGFSIDVNSTSRGYDFDSMPMATNTFSFFISGDNS